MNKKIFFFLSQLNYAYNRKFMYIDVKLSKSLFLLCKLLRQEGILKFYLFIYKNNKSQIRYLRIFLNNDLFSEFSFNTLRQYSYLTDFFTLGLPLCSSVSAPYGKLVINSKPSRRLVISYLELKYSKKFNILRILSTDKGFITDSDALKLKIGGILICTF